MQAQRHREIGWRHVAAVLWGLAFFSGTVEAETDRPLVLTVRIENDSITPVTARFLERAIRQAEQERAGCLVIVLDTPGGLVDATSRIVKGILDSRTCVVVYVAPRGARAASAGGFILLSAHVAAMAPVTRVGAMHPVQIGGLPTMPEPDRPSPADEKKNGGPAEDRRRPAGTPSEQKTVNDTVAWARGLAKLRGRNAEWAERAVRESIVATEDEARELGLIDLVADDVVQLLREIDGREVELHAQTVTLRTAGAEIRSIEMWWGDRILGTVSNPNVAFLLLIFGFYGILFEFYSPGWGVAGTLGVICLMLAFFGLALLPVNYVGLVLIAIALAMFVAEVFVTSYGALAIGGIVCLVMGGLMLVDSPEGFQRVSLPVVLPVAAATAAVTVFLLASIVRAHRGKVQTGAEGLVGTTAAAVADFTVREDHYAGTVRVHGEYWKAVCDAPVAAGQSLTITGRTGLTLQVRAVDSG
ncbi:MAG: nodulation protein NfeD [Planctomycetales bacterium]